MALRPSASGVGSEGAVVGRSGTFRAHCSLSPHKSRRSFNNNGHAESSISMNWNARITGRVSTPAQSVYGKGDGRSQSDLDLVRDWFLRASPETEHSLEKERKKKPS